MILPTINFNGVNKVMFANSEISKVYCGDDLVWEKKDMSNRIVMYTGSVIGRFSKRLYFYSSIDPRISESNIDKIVIMERYTIDGSYVKEVVRRPDDRDIIEFKDTLTALTGLSSNLEPGSKIEIYLK